jgi:membrane protein implicated in regulation of membrane protease activity
MSMKNKIYYFIIIFIILLTIASIYSFHLGFGFMLTTIIIGLLFYYNIKLGIIAFFVILFLFLYVRFFPKEGGKKGIDQKAYSYQIIKEPDNIEHEYDYKITDREEDYSFNNINEENINTTIEGMSNKKKNSGVDRISTETTLRGKDSKTLPISGAFGSPYKEPVSVGKEGTLSGYELIQESFSE